MSSERLGEKVARNITTYEQQKETAEALFKSRSVVWNHLKDVSRQFYLTQEMDRLAENMMLCKINERAKAFEEWDKNHSESDENS